MTRQEELVPAPAPRRHAKDVVVMVVLITVVTFVIGSVMGWVGSPMIFGRLSADFAKIWKELGQSGEAMLTVRSLVMAPLTTALSVGALLALPAAAMSLWQSSAQRRGVPVRLPWLLLPVVAYVVGGIVSYRFAVPHMVSFFAQVGVSSSPAANEVAIAVAPTIMLKDYVRMVAKAAALGGVLLAAPVFISLASWARTIPVDALRSAAPYLAGAAGIAAWFLSPGGLFAFLFVAVLLAVALGVGAGLAHVVKPRA